VYSERSAAGNAIVQRTSATLIEAERLNLTWTTMDLVEDCSVRPQERFTGLKKRWNCSGNKIGP
jgi:hypothetical protein